MLRRGLTLTCALIGIALSGLTFGAVQIGAALPGGVLVFSADANGNSDLFMIDSERGSTLNLTDSVGANEIMPLVSPDGTTILYAYLSSAAYGQRLCTLEPFRRPVSLCAGPDGRFHLVQNWDADSRHYFSLTLPENILYKIDAHTGEVADALPVAPRSTADGWSNDRRYNARLESADGVNRLMLVDTVTGEQRVLLERLYMSTAPRFSPDDSRIAVAAIIGDDPDLEIYTLDVTGEHLFQVTRNDGALDESPAWSPDGAQIAFISDQDTLNPQVYIVNADGSGRRRITDDSERFHRFPGWLR
ncbi:MAG: hypothetical protein SF162_13830 [bacterium]|nr:hypothetical protein [bacterium]